MPRTLNPTAHALRRDAFIDVAQRLIQVKGYEQMSVQDILDRARGVQGRLLPLLRFQGGPAGGRRGAHGRRRDRDHGAHLDRSEPDRSPEAPGRCSPASPAGRPTERISMLALLRVWFSDDNAIVRDKLRQRRRAPPHAVAGGDRPAGHGRRSVLGDLPGRRTARVLVSLLLGANETASQLFLARQAGAVSFEDVELHPRAPMPKRSSESSGFLPGRGPSPIPQALHLWFD